MDDFIFEGVLELLGMRVENYKMQNSCPQWVLNPVPSAYEPNTLIIAHIDPISIEHLKVDLVLPLKLGKYLKT